MNTPRVVQVHASFTKKEKISNVKQNMDTNTCSQLIMISIAQDRDICHIYKKNG